MAKRKKILLVDDVEYIRNIEKKILMRIGKYDIIQAIDGEQGVSHFIKHGPDLTILDIAMPKKNGIAVLTEILEKNPKAKIVMCSAVRDESIIRTCYAIGAKNYIVKPFSDNLFIEIITSTLAQ